MPWKLVGMEKCKAISKIIAKSMVDMAGFKEKIYANKEKSVNIFAESIVRTCTLGIFLYACEA